MNNDYLDLKNWLNETKNEPLETMDSFFDKRISLYEDRMLRWSQHYQWISDLLPDHINSLLDIGCGSGLELDYIFRLYPNLDVTGIDLSQEMLAKLRQKHGDRTITLIQGDYFKYDFGDNKFDCAVSFETLHHFTSDKKKLLFEKIKNCLKDGGVYLECDYIASSLDIENLCLQECNRRRLRDNISVDTFVHFDIPLTLENEMSAMKAAGFSVVELVGYLPHDNHTPIIKAIK